MLSALDFYLINSWAEHTHRVRWRIVNICWSLGDLTDSSQGAKPNCEAGKDQSLNATPMSAVKTNPVPV
jgi:hypothetical protein